MQDHSEVENCYERNVETFVELLQYLDDRSLFLVIFKGKMMTERHWKTWENILYQKENPKLFLFTQN